MARTKKPNQTEEVEINLGRLLHEQLCTGDHVEMCFWDRRDSWVIGGPNASRPEGNVYWMMARRVLEIAKQRGLTAADVVAFVNALRERVDTDGYYGASYRCYRRLCRRFLKSANRR